MPFQAVNKVDIYNKYLYAYKYLSRTTFYETRQSCKNFENIGPFKTRQAKMPVKYTSTAGVKNGHISVTQFIWTLLVFKTT